MQQLVILSIRYTFVILCYDSDIFNFFNVSEIVLKIDKRNKLSDLKKMLEKQTGVPSDDFRVSMYNYFRKQKGLF